MFNEANFQPLTTSTLSDYAFDNITFPIKANVQRRKKGSTKQKIRSCLNNVYSSLPLLNAFSNKFWPQVLLDNRVHQIHLQRMLPRSSSTHGTFPPPTCSSQNDLFKKVAQRVQGGLYLHFFNVASPCIFTMFIYVDDISGT